MAAKKEAQVATKAVGMIIVGFREPEAARRAMIVVGIKVMLDVFIAKNVHIAGEAVSLSGLSSCNCFIA